jgi:hypothetical protein
MIKNNKNLYHKIFKYLIMAISVYTAVKYIPENKVEQKELLMISAIASIVFAILDMVSPSIKQ